MYEVRVSVEEFEFPDVAKPETDFDGDTVLSSEDSTGAFSENTDSDGAAVSGTTCIFYFNILFFSWSAWRCHTGLSTRT